MRVADIRQNFLQFFADQGHEKVPSSPLVPKNDPTLLFTNAGMVQFKDVFLGLESRPYQRAVSVQRCMRAGGKHNDLENVGYTARHHTFFEMLGNFSFGDYFKRDAIRFAWRFLTETLGLPPERLWVTVYQEDDEAAAIWLDEMGIDPARFSRCDAKDNFWSMGDTGPCGPCSEIFFDHGPHIPGGPPGSEDADGDRYVEIWNLVFMQYDRDSDGKLTPLPKPSVDTGMGLERLAAVLQGVHNNYDTDVFQPAIQAAASLAGLRYGEDAKLDTSLRVLADHIRSCSFLITDGVMPANEGRGYVLRRIIRRAIRHGHKLGLREIFFYKLVGPLCDSMGAAYPELLAARADVEKVLKLEEERFLETLENGLKLLDEVIAGLGDARTLPGDAVFKLYDTFGFPVDLTGDIARERGLTVDEAGFEAAMSEQKNRSRAAWSGSGEVKAENVYHDLRARMQPVEFFGYEQLDVEAEVVAILRDGELVDQLGVGESGAVILDRTTFYGESGGQVGDQGALLWDAGRFAVENTQKPLPDLFVHVGRLESGSLRVGQRLTAHVDEQARLDTAYNHSATHLLHAALKTVLGGHVRQMGSLVAPDRLRFDFAHFAPLSQEELLRVEDLVNAEIRANAEAETQVMPIDEAIASGAAALFGEKYGDTVRVVRMGDFSSELCGGTHVRRVGDIGLFRIISESGVASGTRRIEAVTGRMALAMVREKEALLRQVADLLKASPQDAAKRLEGLLEQHRQLERQIEQIRAKAAASQGDNLADRAISLKGVKVLAAQLDGADAKTLRNTLDQLRDKLGNSAIVLAAVQGDKVSLVAGVSKDLSSRIPAGDLVNFVAQPLGGKGGGRPDMAQAGGSNPEKLPDILSQVPAWIENLLG
ncbi:alanine--tRNA ligase [Thermithiobacillus plumbiphilus]|uniref:Alanine--tRNA ligase n=1 Tax=Thermithiobacillus plumbiphilus TaxID=1729899 RepID=A0ABU9D991_9PROT